MPGRPYILAETTWKSIKDLHCTLAILPWGATEAHNYHLPYSTDTLQCDAIAAEAARYAWEKDTPVMVLPTVPFGVNTTQLDIPFCLNMNPSTQFALLHDLVDALEEQGIKKLVIINGHGGNDFRQMIRELFPLTSMFVCVLNWYNCLPPAEYFDDAGDHAGELETSVMMALQPHLVLPLSVAGDGHQKRPVIKAMREGKVWSPRPWTTITADTGVGNPAAATPEKGIRFIAAVAEYLGEFLIELSETPPDRLYA